MAVKRIFESVRSYFSGGNKLPWWCDRGIFKDYEEGVDDLNSWIHKGIFTDFISTFALCPKPKLNSLISVIEGSFFHYNHPVRRRDHFYLLAIGHYRNDNYERSMQLLELCLEITPTWRPALTLKWVVEDEISKDGAIGTDGVLGTRIAATTVGLFLCGIVVSLVRKR